MFAVYGCVEFVLFEAICLGRVSLTRYFYWKDVLLRVDAQVGGLALSEGPDEWGMRGVSRGLIAESCPDL